MGSGFKVFKDSETPVGVAAILSDRRLYLAADRELVVEEGDARAAFLLVAKGSTISAHDVHRLQLQLVDGVVVQGGRALEQARTAAQEATEKKAAAKKAADEEAERVKAAKEKAVQLEAEKAAETAAAEEKARRATEDKQKQKPDDKQKTGPETKAKS